METDPLEHERIVLGLLGGIGAGKSTVASRIAVLGGGAVVDADALAARVLVACARDGRLAATLGEATLTAAGDPDRAAIAQLVFTDDDARRRLEALVHPGVRAQVEESLESHRRGEGPPILILDVPLLLETSLDVVCDALWFVDTPDEIRWARAKARGLEPDDARRREARQLPLDEKRARADHVIRNTDDPTPDILEGLAALGVPIRDDA